MKERIMKYLGSLGGSVNTAMLAHVDDDIAKTAITWDTQQHLKFDMPFVDMKPTIYLGNISLF
jgi:DNA-dependent protein kinase catalytic subunit